jgi:hypothetical protein
MTYDLILLAVGLWVGYCLRELHVRLRGAWRGR